MAYDGGSSLSTPLLNRYAKRHDIDLTPDGGGGGAFDWINEHIIHGKPPGITQFNEALSPPDNDPFYGQFAQKSMRNFVGGVPRFLAGIPEALGAGGGGDQGGGGNAAAGGGQGGGKAKVGGGEKHPILRYIMRQNPGMTMKEARRIRNDYAIQQQIGPGLADFARQQSGQPDPNTMQMFFAKTVAPYLEQTAQQYQQGADAGYAAMQNILSQGQASGGGSAGLDLIKQFLPVQQAGNQMMGAALKGAAQAGPAYDQLLNQLNEAIQQQQRSAYYQQALLAGAGAGGQQQTDYGAAVAGNAASNVQGG